MDRYYRRIVLAGGIAAIAFFAFYLLAASMTRGVTSDEQMYCTGGYLISKGLMIYRDFSYVAQLPYHPLLLGVIYKLTGTTYYLLTARLVSVFFDVCIAVCIFSILRKIFREHYYWGILIAIAGTALFVFNPMVSYLLGLAWNHDMALLCIVGSFRIFMGIDWADTQAPPVQARGLNVCMRIGIIASLLTIAVWTRITSVFVLPIFGTMLIIKNSKNRGCAILAMTIGMIIFSIVPVLIMILSGKSFFINIITMPILNSALLHKLHIAYDKGYLTLMILRNKEYLFLLLFAIVLCIYCICMRKRINFSQKLNAMLAILLFVVSIVIAYFPPTMWRQYFGIPVLFFIIVVGFSLLYLRSMAIIWPFRIFAVLFLGLTIFTIVSQKPITKISKFLAMKNLPPAKLHEISRCIVSKAGTSGKILTLSPLYVVEGGGKIYTELSAGAFGFRVADSLTEPQRAASHTAGVKEFSEIVGNNPPAAIVIGPELTRFEKIDLRGLVPANWARMNCEPSVHVFVPSDTD
ncbi:MAG: hypothetical protein ABFD79_04460 [Phycisphaerales bacterium]